MVVPAGPSRDRHEAATWPLRWPGTFYGSSADARRGGGQQSTAGRTAPNHRVERTATSRCDFDTFGVMKIIRHSLSARSVAVAHPSR
jgi:hypothetical protein